MQTLQKRYGSTKQEAELVSDEERWECKQCRTTASIRSGSLFQICAHIYITYILYILIYITRLPIHKNPPKLTQNVYKAAKRNEYPCNMSRRVGRNLYETVCRQMQTN